MTRKILTTILCLVLSAVSSPAADQADATFAHAASLADSDLTASRELYRIAALEYQAEAKARPANRGPLFYNAGNAFFLAGDPGQAVVAYRRAQQAMPGSRLLRENLAFVRKQSGNPDETPRSGRFAFLRFWAWIPATQWSVLAAAWLAFWAAILHRQWTGTRRWPRPVLAAALGCSLLSAGTLAFQHLRQAKRCRAVIVTPATQALKGPNYGYQAAFTNPLDAGLECDVVAADGDWRQIRFDPDRECWVRSSTIEIWQGRAPAP